MLLVWKGISKPNLYFSPLHTNRNDSGDKWDNNNGDAGGGYWRCYFVI